MSSHMDDDDDESVQEVGFTTVLRTPVSRQILGCHRIQLVETIL